MKAPKLTTTALFVWMILSSLSAQNGKKAVTLADWPVVPIELKALNSPQRDINLSITPDGRYLYFMTGRGRQPWSRQGYTTFRGRPEADGDIWYAEKKDGQWGLPICMQEPVNTGMGEDEPNISADGQTVWFQSWRSSWRSDGGPYYQADLHGDQWENLKGLGGGIGAFFRIHSYATDGMSVAPNGKILVVACGPVYDGPMDLYISRKNASGEWELLQKLDISTSGDERSAFIAADNKTLYFGSDAYGGFGKLDIFKTTLETGAKTGELINIGSPFNTPDDDYGFVLDGQRNDAYFVRNGDIWFANLGTEIDRRIQPEAIVIINGVIRDKNRLMEAQLTLSSDQTGEVIATARSNSRTGAYSLSAPKLPGEYTLSVALPEGYSQLEEKITLDDRTGETLEISFAPKPLQPGPEEKSPVSETFKAIVFFDFDQVGLSETAKQELDRLAEIAQSTGNYAIRVIGYTDNVGSTEYNQRLSERRAAVVAAYFVRLGLEVKTEGFGETAPVTANDTPDGRKKNRRSEVVLEKRD